MPDLTVSPAQLTFGEVWEDSRFPWVLTLHNPGEEAVVIAEFKTSCDCVNLEPKSLTIPAGGSRDVRLVLDLTSPGKDVAGAKLRAFEVMIAALLPDEIRPAASRTWDIRGVVRPAIGISPPVVNLGRVSERVSPETVTHVDIVAHVPIERLETRSSSREFKVRVARSGTSALRFGLSVSPQKGIAKGEKAVDIDVTPYDKAGKPLGTRKVALRASVVGDVRPSSDGVVFGTQDVGARLEETVTLQSLTGRACTAVEKVTCEGEGSSAEAVPSPLVGTIALSVRLHVIAAGAYRGRVVASVRCADGAVEEVGVTVSAYGIEMSQR